MRKPVLVIGALAALSLVAVGTRIATAGAADDPSVYEAEAGTATLSGGARVDSCKACSGGKKVGWVGYKGTLTFTGVSAATAGPTPVTITYASGERRVAELTVNGGAPVALNFAKTGGYTKPGTMKVTVTLKAGTNTLVFANPRGWAPDFDKIQVGSAPAPDPRPSDPTPPPTTPPPTTPPPVDPPPVDPPPVDPILTAETEVYELVKAARKAAGCKVDIRNDSRLAKAARLHSKDQADRGYFGHTTPDGVDFITRIEKQGYKWRGAGENIAKGQRTPAEAMNSWMNSAGHKANILNCGFNDIGVGLAYDSKKTAIWTQDFGTAG